MRGGEYGTVESLAKNLTKETQQGRAGQPGPKIDQV